MYYRGCWHMYWPWLQFKFNHDSNLRISFTTSVFFTCISLLSHACAYCSIFFTAAGDERLFSYLLWLILLSNQLGISGLTKRFLNSAHLNSLIPTIIIKQRNLKINNCKLLKKKKSNLKNKIYLNYTVFKTIKKK